MAGSPAPVQRDFSSAWSPAGRKLVGPTLADRRGRRRPRRTTESRPAGCCCWWIEQRQCVSSKRPHQRLPSLRATSGSPTMATDSGRVLIRSVVFSDRSHPHLVHPGAGLFPVIVGRQQYRHRQQPAEEGPVGHRRSGRVMGLTDLRKRPAYGSRKVAGP